MINVVNVLTAANAQRLHQLLEYNIIPQGISGIYITYLQHK